MKKLAIILSTQFLLSTALLSCQSAEQQHPLNKKIVKSEGKELDQIIEAWTSTFISEQNEGKSWKEADLIASEQILDRVVTASIQ